MFDFDKENNEKVSVRNMEKLDGTDTNGMLR